MDIQEIGSEKVLDWSG